MGNSDHRVVAASSGCASANAENEPIIGEEVERDISGAWNCDRAGKNGLEGEQRANPCLISITLRNDGSREVSVDVCDHIGEWTRAAISHVVPRNSGSGIEVNCGEEL